MLPAILLAPFFAATCERHLLGSVQHATLVALAVISPVQQHVVDAGRWADRHMKAVLEHIDGPKTWRHEQASGLAIREAAAKTQSAMAFPARKLAGCALALGFSFAMCEADLRVTSETFAAAGFADLSSPIAVVLVLIGLAGSLYLFDRDLVPMRGRTRSAFTVLATILVVGVLATEAALGYFRGVVVANGSGLVAHAGSILIFAIAIPLLMTLSLLLAGWALPVAGEWALVGLLGIALVSFVVINLPFVILTGRATREESEDAGGGLLDATRNAAYWMVSFAAHLGRGIWNYAFSFEGTHKILRHRLQPLAVTPASAPAPMTAPEAPSSPVETEAEEPSSKTCEAPNPFEI
jgi:hypothetical protein